MADLRTALQEAIETHRDDEPIAGERQIVEKADPEADKIVEKAEPDKVENPRDDSGKFAPKQEAQEKNEPVDQVQRPARPNTWKKEYWESFDKLDPKLASYINEREHQIHTGIEQYREKAQLAQTFESIAAPYMETMRSQGKTPVQKFSELLQAENMLQNGSPEQKAQMFQNLAQVYGVNLGQQTQQYQQPQFDPRMVEEIVNNKLVEQTTQSQLNDFLKSPPEHFESVANDMIQLLQADMANSYQDAYDKAVRLHPEIYDQIIAKQQESQMAKLASKSNEAAKAAKSKAVSVKGSSTGTKTTTSSGSDRRSAIADAIREASANRI